MAICSCCGQTIRTAKAKPDPWSAVNTADMTTDQLYAHYKATAPGLDLAFFANRVRLSPAQRDEAIDLIGFTHPDGRLKGITRAEFYRRLRNLQDSWRSDTAAIDRAERLTEQEAA